jgi:hypothetical protein
LGLYTLFAQLNRGACKVQVVGGRHHTTNDALPDSQETARDRSRNYPLKPAVLPAIPVKWLRSLPRTHSAGQRGTETRADLPTYTGKKLVDLNEIFIE